MDKNLKVLELDKILKLLANEASSEEARNKALNLTPSNDIVKVNKLLKETFDAHMLIARFGSPSFGDVCNIKAQLERSKINSVLTMAEFLKIARLLRALRGLKEWKERSDGIKTVLDPMFNAINPNKYFEEKIFNSIISENEISVTNL